MQVSKIEKQHLKNLQRKIKTMQNKPQPAQRTEEWFKARNTRITASELASCLMMTEKVCKTYVEIYNIKNFKYNPNKCCSHFDTKEEYIIKKCCAFYGESVFKDTIYTLWGKKYEDIATRLYRKVFKTTVLEFGFIPHSRLKYLGMSPDGAVWETGKLLEIKVPFKRKIDTKIVPQHYWQQMQLQLEVSNLDECDFLECEVKELPSEQTFLQQTCSDEQQKGILLNIIEEPNGSDNKYIYPPDHLSSDDDYIKWANQIISQECKEITPVYYFIDKWNVIVVKRHKEWFNSVKDEIKETYNRIMHFQADEQLFYNYKESIEKIKNKKYLEKYDETVCCIDDSEVDG